MIIITGRTRSDVRWTEWLRNIPIAVAMLGSLLCHGPAWAAESRADGRPMLAVPLTDSQPVIDGKLEEACWKNAARTGPLTVAQGEPGKFTTEAFILRDADQLYVALRCAGAANVAGGKFDVMDKANRRLVFEVVLSEDEGNFKFAQTKLPDEAKKQELQRRLEAIETTDERDLYY